MSTKKYVTLVLVVAATVGLDQWTKIWAENSLANGDHPLPVHVTAAEAGRTLGDVLTARFPELTGEALTSAIAEDVSLLSPAAGLTADTRVFSDPAARAPGYYVFARSSLDQPPRRVLRQDHVLSERWLALARPDVADDERQAAVTAALGEVKLEAFVEDRVPYLSAKDAAAVAAKYTYPIPPRNQGLTADRQVAEGDVYLLTHRKIVVIPGFFQLVYAENPGAAWSFLAQAHESFRRIFFGLVSLIAAVVILIVVVRLDPSHRMATVAFSAILAGALGNFIDRMRFNFVIDFIDNFVGTAHWPTYNVADIAISVGVGLLLYEMLLKKNSTLFRETDKPEVARSSA